jgi:hypothetical protein
VRDFCYKQQGEKALCSRVVAGCDFARSFIAIRGTLATGGAIDYVSGDAPRDTNFTVLIGFPSSITQIRRVVLHLRQEGLWKPGLWGLGN